MIIHKAVIMRLFKDAVIGGIFSLTVYCCYVIIGVSIDLIRLLGT